MPDPSADTSVESTIPAFARDDSPTREFLRAEAANANGARFPARNFLLDEGVVDERAGSYHRVAGVDFADGAAWKQGHTSYLKEQVRLEIQRGIPRKLDPENPKRCPESFRHDEVFRDYGRAFGKLRLLRVIEADFVARTVAGDVEGLLEACAEVLGSRAEGREPEETSVEYLASALESLEELCDLRPVWATFLEDHEDLFGATSAEDAAGWADDLRDRLGLDHVGPSKGGSKSILVFSYPVSAVPKRDGLEGRALAIPTVLDGALSPAFCPAPKHQPAGRLVNLSGEDREPSREIIHPFFVPKVEHLFRVGEVTRKVPADLGSARAQHLRRLRQASPTYADATDADLLGEAP